MVGYPTKKKPQQTSGVYRSGKGMAFEEEINQSNEFYRIHERGLIYKKPTPIQVVRTDNQNKNYARIVEAYYRTPSTTDYNGVYRGKYIDFEAKQIQSKVSFPLQFIHEHQVEHLRQVLKHGGIGFVLMQFSSYSETYLIDAADVIMKYDDINCKSLTYEWVKEKGHLVKEGYQPQLDYLAVIDDVYFKGE